MSSNSLFDSKRDFWENQHQKKDTYWLTGSSAQNVLRYHGNPPISGIILDIGIGMARFMKDISKTHTIMGVDISPEAVKRGSQYGDCFLVDQLSSVPPVDWAFCHLVFQHCSDEIVQKIIDEVPLKPGGIFSFQFAYINPGETPTDFLKTVLAQGQHYLRDETRMNEILTKTSKRIVKVANRVSFHHPENLSWSIYQVTNR